MTLLHCYQLRRTRSKRRNTSKYPITCLQNDTVNSNAIYIQKHAKHRSDSTPNQPSGFGLFYLTEHSPAKPQGPRSCGSGDRLFFLSTMLSYVGHFMDELQHYPLCSGQPSLAPHRPTPGAPVQPGQLSSGAEGAPHESQSEMHPLGTEPSSSSRCRCS